MGHMHNKETILDEALAAAFDDGLSQLTFGRLARRMDISDRIVVYYFHSKEALIGEVMASLGVQLQRSLAEAFASAERDHRALVRKAWPVLAHPDADPLFALYFEAVGLAAAGRDPYRTLVPELIGAWVDWDAELIEGTRRSDGPEPRPPLPSSTVCSSCARSPDPRLPVAHRDNLASRESTPSEPVSVRFLARTLACQAPA